MKDMTFSLKSVKIRNFKSLRETEIEVNPLNILIGPNGSGKTNILEIFKFVNLCLKREAAPVYPFAPWWGYGNLVWMGKEELSIEFGLDFHIGEYSISYNAIITGYGGALNFIKENLKIDNVLEFSRDYSTAKLIHNSDFINEFTKSHPELKDIGWAKSPGQSNSIDEIRSIQTIEGISPSISFLNIFLGSSWQTTTDKNYCLGRANVVTSFPPIANPPNSKTISFLSPPTQIQEHFSQAIFPGSIQFIQFPNDVILIKQINYSSIKQPTPLIPGVPITLSENGEGLINLLFQWFTASGGKLPERFDSALRELFPNWQIGFTVTNDGRIMLNVKEGDLTLQPPSVPDGLYRLLVILAAVELKPKILLIDEIETSMHLKMIEYLMSTFKTSKSTVILTTHSPMVVDLAQIEDLIILEKPGYETMVHRVKDPDQVRKKLQKDGLTTSESWLYGTI